VVLQWCVDQKEREGGVQVREMSKHVQKWSEMKEREREVEII
jgi:hypothetical protein